MTVIEARFAKADARELGPVDIHRMAIIELAR